MTDYIPPMCSERESGGYEDCTWASGVMLWNAVQGHAAVPSTRAEYEALRVEGGDGPAENPGDGSNLRDLVTGMRNRYGWTPPRSGPPGDSHPSFAKMMTLALAQPGDVAVVQGLMGAFPRDSHWNRWDRQFRGSHATLCIRRDTQPRVWWMNPLAPNAHHGEWMSLADLRKYWDSWIGGVAYGQVGMFSLPDTGTGDDDMGLRFSLVAHATGVATIRGADHALIRVHDKSHVPVPAGQAREVYAKVRLTEPLDAHDGDRQTGFLVGELWPPTVPNVEAAFILASDVTYREQ